jgi:hypothetical protein
MFRHGSGITTRRKPPDNWYDMRSTEAQLLEAELMNSTPEHVYSWLRNRAEMSDNDEQYDGDEELEESLLKRGSPLIDLGLARYGHSATVVRRLFLDERCGGENNGQILGGSGHASVGAGRLLRLAALSNRTLMKHGGTLEKMPLVLFTDDVVFSDLEPIREFVEAADPDEVLALFQNPTIDGEVLAKLYEKEAPFERLGEERWQELIAATIGNPRLRADYVGPMDGWAEYMHGRVFNEAWALAQRVPTTVRWSRLLVRLLDETSSECFSIKDKMAAIRRWNVPSSTGTEPRPNATEASQYGYLDDFGSMRLVLAKLMSESEVHDLKNHEDVAMRCAFYVYGRLTRQDLLDAFSKEPRFLLNYALENKAIWRRSETRETLHELCLQAAKPDSDLWFANAYRTRSDRLETEHPEWFRESHGEQRELPSQPGPSNELIALKAVQAVQGDILNQILALRSRITVLLGVACIAFALISFRKC